MEDGQVRSGSSRWVKVGAIAGISVLSAGLAATWWYRQAVKKLRAAEESGKNTEFGISEDEAAERASRET
jgi:hypothetical protein